jgi:hypothetical protein
MSPSFLNLKGMDTVLQLARHILRFQPNKDAARLCFYHFLIHHCEPTDKVTPELIENFNRFVLSFEHWRKNRQQLVQEVQYFLHHFAETYQVNLAFKNMVMPDRWQVVAIENPIDGLKILEKKFSNLSAKSRLIPAHNNTFILLTMDETQAITVTHLNHLMMINAAGDLEPLNPLIKIHYTADLSLQFQKVQYVEVAPSVMARFMILGPGMHGSLIRGYTFQKAEEFKGGSVAQYPQVLYAIKRLEQHYVDRKSDPMYKELTQLLEKAIELVNIRHPEALTFGQAALERGESAKENIFQNDNMIRLLTQTLRSSLQNNRNLIITQEKQREIPWQKDQLLIE